MEYPEIIGFCVYGSTVQERVDLESSDIDAYVFIDTDALKISKRDYQYLIDPDNKQITDILLPEELHEHYTTLIRSALMNSLGFPEEKVHHVRVRPLSKQVLDELVEDILPHAQEVVMYQKLVAQTEKEKATYDIEFEKWINGKRNELPKEVSWPKFPKSFFIGGILSDIFYMSIGKRMPLTRLRKYLIENLQNL